MRLGGIMLPDEAEDALKSGDYVGCHHIGSRSKVERKGACI